MPWRVGEDVPHDPPRPPAGALIGLLNDLDFETGVDFVTRFSCHGYAFLPDGAMALAAFRSALGAWTRGRGLGQRVLPDTRGRCQAPLCTSETQRTAGALATDPLNGSAHATGGLRRTTARDDLVPRERQAAFADVTPRPAEPRTVTGPPARDARTAAFLFEGGSAFLHERGF